MAQEMELSDYDIVYELKGPESSGSQQSGATPTERLFRIGILTLGVLCIVQGILNISLGLAFYLKEDTDQFPFNSSVIADMCQIDQSQQNSTQSCSCCKNLLRRLLREYQALETERDILRKKIDELTRDKIPEEPQGSGSGIPEDFLALGISRYS